MSDDTAIQSTNRRDYLRAVGGVAVLGTAGLAGCLDDDAAGATGLLSTAVTDQPGDIADFDSCVVTIDGIWVKPRDGDDDVDEDEDDDTAGDDDEETDDDGVQEQDEEDIDEGSGREYYAFDEPQEADLVDLQDGRTQLVDEDRELPVGDYQFLQLDVSNVEGILAEDGSEADVDTPGNAPLQFKLRFEIRDNQRTTFTGDFTPVRRGRTNRYLLQPVARNTSVSYEEIEADGADEENGDDENNADDENSDDE